MPLAKFRQFSTFIFFKHFTPTLSPFLSSPVLWDSDDMNVRPFATVLTGPWGSVPFFSFSVCFLFVVHIGQFLSLHLQICWFFPLTSPSCCWVYPPIFFFFSYCSFQFSNSHLVFLYMFFVRLLFFVCLCLFVCFKHVCNCLLKHMYNGYFKILVRSF